MTGPSIPHPRDRFITVYGRKPALEALRDDRLEIDKLLIARNVRGSMIDELLAAAKRRGIKVRRVQAKEVTRLSRNGRQDQGVVVDVSTPAMSSLEAWLETYPADAPARLFLLDGVTTPANVGMILRATTAAGVHGVVLPRVGCPEVGPLVIKASAGIAFHAPILRSTYAVEAAQALRAAGFVLVGLRANDAESLYDAPLPPRAVYVLGNEALGVSDIVAEEIERWFSIPMHGGVESLNVATAGAVVAFEVARRA